MSRHTEEEILKFEASETNLKLYEYSCLVANLELEIAKKDVTICDRDITIETLEKKLSSLEEEAFKIFKENCLYKGIDWRELADHARMEEKDRRGQIL